VNALINELQGICIICGSAWRKRPGGAVEGDLFSAWLFRQGADDRQGVERPTPQLSNIRSVSQRLSMSLAAMVDGKGRKPYFWPSRLTKQMPSAKMGGEIRRVRRRQTPIRAGFLPKSSPHTRLLLTDADLAHAERSVLVVVGVLLGHAPPHARRGKFKAPRLCVFLESRHDLMGRVRVRVGGGKGGGWWVSEMNRRVEVRVWLLRL
jgi:hypothetical protein